MGKSYRALISVPIVAASDDAALAQADEYAAQLCHPGSACIAGHTEVVGEGELVIARPIYIDPQFGAQLRLI